MGTLGFTGNSLKRYRHQGQFGMAVLKEYWGRGIGSRLIDTLVEWANSVGITRITLQVDKTNLQAIALYKKFGFREEGTLIKDALVNGIYRDSIIMARICES